MSKKLFLFITLIVFMGNYTNFFFPMNYRTADTILKKRTDINSNNVENSQQSEDKTHFSDLLDSSGNWLKHKAEKYHITLNNIVSEQEELEKGNNEKIIFFTKENNPEFVPGQTEDLNVIDNESDNNLDNNVVPKEQHREEQIEKKDTIFWIRETVGQEQHLSDDLEQTKIENIQLEESLDLVPEIIDNQESENNSHNNKAVNVPNVILTEFFQNEETISLAQETPEAKISQQGQYLSNSKSEVVFEESNIQKNSSFGISFDKNQLMYFGAGAVAIIIICGVTYVLYKNGTLKKISCYISEHKIAVSTTITALCVFALTGMYYVQQYNSSVLI